MPQSAPRRVHGVALSLTAALIASAAALLIAGEPSPPRLFFALVATAPLFYGFWRLRRGERRVYAWMTLLAIPYMALAVTEAVANPGVRLWAGACLFTAFALFVALIAGLRVTRH